MEIESSDVVRLIEQFLKENNLLRTLQTLQDESSITLNTVDSVEGFTSDIEHGRWDAVLRTVGQLRLPSSKLLDLYEHIVLELIEMKEIGAARSLLRQTEPMNVLRLHYQDRYLHLESLLSRSHFDEREAYGDAPKEERRREIARALAKEVTVVAPARLLSLLGQAMKWQHAQGLLAADTPFDLFRGSAQSASVADRVPSTRYQNIKFSKKQHTESAAFSPDGQFLAVGAVDGIIEIYNHATGKLRKDLKYQAEGNPMLMETAVLCMAFSRDAEYLVSGAQDGNIKVWKIAAGAVVRRFSGAHSLGVTSVCFTKDGSQVLSASFDTTARIHGIKSGKLLKEFRGHASFVNEAIFATEARVLTCGSDGVVKIWDAKACTCLHSVVLSEGVVAPPGTAGVGVTRLLQHPRMPDQVVVLSKGPWIHIIDSRGQVSRAFSLAKQCPAGFVAGSLSQRGDLLYLAGEDRQLHCLRLETGSVDGHPLQLADFELIGMVCHPFANVLAAWDESGSLGLWK
ncbi:WD40-repeat-containing domain protein [Hyaloraphidium curvatum]|nr:WD40-repeat-containing domain protein [Hyaloraphidium curvatum]